jgi:hypothetical protein
VAVLIRPGVQLDSNPFSYAARKIIQVEAVVQSYNDAVAPYTSSKNQMFKQSLLNKLHELLNPIGSIRGGLLKLVTSIMNKMAAADSPLRTTLNFYFVRFIEALAVYDLMYEYIKSAKLLRITSEDAKARSQDLINQKAAWRSVASHDDVRPLFRDFDFGSGGTDDGGPPPGGGPPPFQRGYIPKQQPPQPPPGGIGIPSSSTDNRQPPPPPPDRSGIAINTGPQRPLAPTRQPDDESHMFVDNVGPPPPPQQDPSPEPVPVQVRPPKQRRCIRECGLISMATPTTWRPGVKKDR